jgi:peptide chain release factor subunit 1
MSIDYLKLEQLSEQRSNEHPMVSLYLNVTPPRDYTSDLNSLLHQARLRVQSSDQYTEQQQEELERVFRSLEKHIRQRGRPESGTKLIAIFANAAGTWEEFSLPVGLASQISVEPDPAIRPLSILLNEFNRYCVLVADTRKARIFSLFLGEFEDHPGIFMENEVPDRVKVNLSMTSGSGGDIRGGLGDQRIQRHIDDHVHRHLRDVAERTFRFFQKKGFNRLIIGGHKDKILPRLKNQLHSYLLERLAGEFYADIDDKDEELRDKALQTAQTFEREQEKELLERLQNEHDSGGKAVLGVEPTLEALLFGQVHTLILDSRFEKPGYACPHDHYLSTYVQQCPVCGHNMAEVPDLGDEMTEEAVNQNAEMEHIFQDIAPLSEHGVAALLRFTV